ncbi:cysteine--tRNA ligase [Pseudooceanicola atlanticus]|uniref:Cysteine--tRNA ligase n=1 Tax=Pseudooceanicola atlanticus TaxID=1461694 RepID=A0A0A0EFI1_9RHOB|nr:cysteine--tRNA ligase [Pseudooceanicola atlanticus]KGM48833.1 cysteinyl-tRNA synthetase [Pseudooceanicola atlanticus]
MVEIRLTNSKTRKKEVFTPIDPENVRMYVCGPTVYDRAHLGNARPVVVFDVLNRLLRHVAKENGWGKVTYVRNFTDVDDKINATALQRKEAGAPGTLEELIAERTEETIRWYHEDMDALGTLRPDHEPRATEYIGQMIAMIEQLILDKHAYPEPDPRRHNQDNAATVYFDARSFNDRRNFVEPVHALFDVESFEEYGNLSGRSVEDMIAGARVEVANYKKNPMDFVLWKPSTDDLPGWDSPWGRGRPGWHIECSAMSKALLGDVFDIHGGGNDLMFPHHENEIAQSCCANHTDRMANFWLHNEMLQVEGKKMSKSLGNFFTVRDLLDQGVPGEVIRFVFMGTHYRKPMDWTEEKRVNAELKLQKYIELIRQFGDLEHAKTLSPMKAIVDALASDLNTPLALTGLDAAARSTDGSQLARDLVFLGFYTWSELAEALEGQVTETFDLGDWEDTLISARAEAMETKDFSRVDTLKQALVAAGVEVRMSKAGVELIPGPDFDPAKLEGLS